MCVSLSLCVVCCCGARGCGCGCGCGGGRGRRGGEGERLIEPSGPKFSFNIAETEQLYQVKRMIGGIGHVLFSIYSHKIGQIQKFLW